MLVFEVRGNVNAMDHFLDDSFVDRFLCFALARLARGFLLVDFDAISKQTPSVLLSQSLQQGYRGLCRISADELTLVGLMCFEGRSTR